MYNYKVYFALAKEDVTFNFKSIEKQIQDSISKYHEGKNIRNKKKLSCKVFEEYIEIEINSPVVLEFPSKSLAKFTRILLVEAPQLSEFIVHKRVFKSISPAILNKSNVTNITNIDAIDDLETVKKVMDLFFEKPPITFDEKRIRDNKQKEIKKIIFDLN